MTAKLNLGDLAVDVVRKDIKNVHLSVHPPTGRVRISAPARMSLDTIRLFAIEKLPWIRRQQLKMLGQARQTPREYLDRESHYVWGRRVLLKVEEVEGPAEVELRHTTLWLRVRPGADAVARESSIATWYREQLRAEALPRIAHWESRLGVSVEGLAVRRMKTKWGSCTRGAGTIRLNTELAMKPKGCLEYIIVHELLHMLEPRHGERFTAMMDGALPTWRQLRELLNGLPASHQRWSY